MGFKTRVRLQDEFHDVRLNIVSHAGLICEVLSVDGLAGILESSKSGFLKASVLTSLNMILNIS